MFRPGEPITSSAAVGPDGEPMGLRSWQRMRETVHTTRRAVGRNNWIFFGSDQGGKTAAVLRSLVASCQRAEIDPFIWFKDVLSRIAAHPITRLAELLPHNWAPSQA
jgi:hypothetical protein